MKAILLTVMYVMFCSVLFCFVMLCYVMLCMYVCMYEIHFVTLPLHLFDLCRYHRFQLLLAVVMGFLFAIAAAATRTPFRQIFLRTPSLLVGRAVALTCNQLLEFA